MSIPLIFFSALCLGMLVGTFSSEYDQITAPQFYSCENKTFKYSSVHCVEECKSDLVTDISVFVDIYKASNIHNILFGTCRKFQRTTILTKTWTFSTLPPVVKYSSLNPDISGCLHNWESLCDKRECLTREPDVPKDYEWAADREFVDVYYILDIGLENEPVALGDNLKILTPDGFVEYDHQFKLTDTGDLMYLWEIKDLKDGACNTEVWKTIECFKTTTLGKFFCPSISMFLSAVHMLKDNRCGSSLYLDSDMVFGFNRDEGTTYTTTSGILEISGALDVVIKSIQEKIKKMEDDSCFDKCMNLQRIKPGELVVLPTRMIKKKAMGIYTSCKFMPHCSIVYPLVLCSPGHLAAISCGPLQTWWNFSDGLEVSPVSCQPKGSSESEVEIEVGPETLIINKTGTFWETREGNEAKRLHVLDSHSVLSLTPSHKISMVSSYIQSVMSRMNDTTSRHLITAEIIDYASSFFSALYDHIAMCLGIFLMITGVCMVMLCSRTKRIKIKYEKPRETISVEEQSEELMTETVIHS